jgi:hypothetical protein
MTMNEKISESMLIQLFQWSLIALCITTIPFLTVFLYFDSNWYYPIIGILQLLLLLFLLISFTKIPGIFTLKKDDWNWLFAWMFLMIGWILYVFGHIQGDGSEIRKAISSIDKCIVLFIGLPIIRFSYIAFAKRYFFICNIMIVLSVILFFLLVIGIFPFIPTTVFENEQEGIHYNFFIGTTNVWLKFGKTQVIRIAGWLEEPGALALVITYLIMINELIFHSKNERIFLHLTGLLTFSMAFIISIFLLLPTWWKGSFRITKNMDFFLNKKRFIVSLFSISVIIIILIQLLSQESEAAKSDIALSFQAQYLIRRFTYDSDKKSLKGDNRFYIERQIDNIWFGDGEKIDDVASLQAVINRNGIVPVIFFYIPIIFLTVQIIIKIGFRRGKWFAITIWANIMQRPYIENLHIMVLWSIIYFSLDNKTNYCSSIESSNKGRK